MRRAAALGVEGGVGDRPSLDAQRDAHEVAAGSAAGAADDRAVGHGPAAARVAQMLARRRCTPHGELNVEVTRTAELAGARPGSAGCSARYLRREAFETNWLIVW